MQIDHYTRAPSAGWVELSGVIHVSVIHRVNSQQLIRSIPFPILHISFAKLIKTYSFRATIYVDPVNFALVYLSLVVQILYLIDGFAQLKNHTENT